jgi:hypothetical protein
LRGVELFRFRGLTTALPFARFVAFESLALYPLVYAPDDLHVADPGLCGVLELFLVEVRASPAYELERRREHLGGVEIEHVLHC